MIRLKITNTLLILFVFIFSTQISFADPDPETATTMETEANSMTESLDEDSTEKVTGESQLDLDSENNDDISDPCTVGKNAPFSAENISKAEQAYEDLRVRENNASEFHYQRELALTAVINARSNPDNKVNPQDILLVTKCDGLDKNNPSTEQLQHCMEHLHDLMENELAFRFNMKKSWEKFCDTNKSLKCKDSVQQYTRGDANITEEIDDNGVCILCDNLGKTIDSCRKGI